jgi:hypothetical protein
METPHNKKKPEKSWKAPKGQDSDGAYGRLFQNRNILWRLYEAQ